MNLLKKMFFKSILLLFAVIIMYETSGCGSNITPQNGGLSGEASPAVSGNASITQDLQANSSDTIYLDGMEKTLSDRDVPNEVIRYAESRLNDIVKTVYSEDKYKGDFPDFTKNDFSADDFSVDKPFRIKIDDTNYYYLFPVRWKEKIADFLTVTKNGSDYSAQYGGNFYPEPFREIDNKGQMDKVSIVSKNNVWYAKIGNKYIDHITPE